MKKSNFVIISLLFFFIISLLLNFSYYFTNSEMLNEINKRDTIINTKYKVDTSISERFIKSNIKINEYFKNCNFIINGKNVSSDELLTFLNDKIIENNKLKDSLNDFKSQITLNLKHNIKNYLDSIQLLNFELYNIKETFGIKSNAKRVDNKIVFYRGEITEIDSGLYLLPYFRDNLKIKEIGDGKIEITITKDKIIYNNVKKSEKRNRKR